MTQIRRMDAPFAAPAGRARRAFGRSFRPGGAGRRRGGELLRRLRPGGARGGRHRSASIPTIIRIAGAWWWRGRARSCTTSRSAPSRRTCRGSAGGWTNCASSGSTRRPASSSNGLWLRDHDGNLVEIRVAEKVSPDAKSAFENPSCAPGLRGAPSRSKAPKVRPRRLSHVLLFTRDVMKAIAFYRDVLGLRLSDRAGDIIAFMHGIHGSDHHMLAFAKSDAPGLQHCELGRRLDQRHLAAARCRWRRRDLPPAGGSAATWSARIISTMCATRGAATPNIPPTSTTSRSRIDWEGEDHPGEDLFSAWGPEPPPEFVVNYEE